MVTKKLVFPSTGSSTIRCCSRTAIRVKHSAVAEGITSTVRFQPRLADVFVSDVVDGQEQHLEACASAFDVVREVPEGYWVDEIEGKIPSELEGTYYKNGPGDFNFLNEPVTAPLDANGIVTSVAIKDGKAFFRSRFVKTKESLLEERAGKRLFRGVFGTIPKHGVAPFRLMKTRSAANGKPILANDKLYAPYEECAMSEVDVTTLETLYPKLPDAVFSAPVMIVHRLFDLVGKIFGHQWRLVSKGPLYLNPKTERGFGDSQHDFTTKRTIAHNYQTVFSWSKKCLHTKLKVFEFDDSFRVHAHQNYVLERAGLVHSVGITDNYYVFSPFPFEVDVKKVLDSEDCFINSMVCEAAGNKELYLIPRHPEKQNNTNEKVIKFKLNEATCILHFVNTFEEGEDIIIDALHYSAYPFLGYGKKAESDYRHAEPYGAILKRTVCSPNGEVKTRAVSDHEMELSSIHPGHMGKSYRYAYMIAIRNPHDQTYSAAIAKVDVKTGGLQLWTKGPHYVVGEPLFIPSGLSKFYRALSIALLGPGSDEEDDGWVIAFMYNGVSKKTEFVVLDAKNWDKGPLATLYLKETMGYGLHGIWTHKYYGPLRTKQE